MGPQQLSTESAKPLKDKYDKTGAGRGKYRIIKVGDRKHSPGTLDHFG